MDQAYQGWHSWSGWRARLSRHAKNTWVAFPCFAIFGRLTARYQQGGGQTRGGVLRRPLRTSPNIKRRGRQPRFISSRPRRRSNLRQVCHRCIRQPPHTRTVLCSGNHFNFNRQQSAAPDVKPVKRYRRSVSPIACREPLCGCDAGHSGRREGIWAESRCVGRMGLLALGTGLRMTPDLSDQAFTPPTGSLIFHG